MRSLVRSALDRGDLEWLRQNADRLAPVRLTDALRICLIIRDRESVQYERAAMRWLSRFALEARNATPLTDLRRAAEALGSLPEDDRPCNRCSGHRTAHCAGPN
jgi:hypothetical protein